MFKRRLTEPFGKAGLTVAIVALAFAMIGGAYAATGGSGGRQIATASKKKKSRSHSNAGLNGKQKKEVKKISKTEAKKFATAGPQGPAGPAGPAGARGATGATGTPGTNGTNGTDGEDGEDGTDGEAGMCSEANPECVLASGATLAGVWSASNISELDSASSVSYLSSISFPVQVSPAPTALVGIPFFGQTVAYRLEDGNGEIAPVPNPLGQEEFEEDLEFWSKSCPGNASEPKAAPGFLCIYVGEEFAASPGAVKDTVGDDSEVEAPNEHGVVVPWKLSPKTNLRGTWAVTAE